MRVIARSTLTAFAERNPTTRGSLAHWLAVCREARWTTTDEVRQAFSKAKVLNAERVRFEISGGDFRLIIAFDFGRQIALIKFLDSHAEYDRVDALTGRSSEELMMDIRPIRNDEDHATALREIERLWGAQPGTRDGDALDVLATLVDRYEEERFRFPDADPVEVLEAYMRSNGLARKDLAEVLGSQPRATEILSRRRSLSLEQIRRLHRAWRIPAELLIGEARRAVA